MYNLVNYLDVLLVIVTVTNMVLAISTKNIHSAAGWFIATLVIVGKLYAAIMVVNWMSKKRLLWKLGLKQKKQYG